MDSPHQGSRTSTASSCRYEHDRCSGCGRHLCASSLCDHLTTSMKWASNKRSRFASPDVLSEDLIAITRSNKQRHQNRLPSPSRATAGELGHVEGWVCSTARGGRELQQGLLIMSGIAITSRLILTRAMTSRSPNLSEDEQTLSAKEPSTCRRREIFAGSGHCLRRRQWRGERSHSGNIAL